MTRNSIRLLAGPALLVMAAVAPAQPSGRPWRVEDSLGMRHVVTSLPSYGRQNYLFPTGMDGPDRFVTSPNGDRFFFITYRGDLGRDCVENELLAFATTDLARAFAGGSNAPAQPVARVSFCSRSQSPFLAAIAFARWADNDTIIFRGSNGTAVGDQEVSGAIFRLSVPENRLTQVSPIGPLRDGNIAEAGGSWLYASVDFNRASPYAYPVSYLRSNFYWRYTYGGTLSRRLIASYRGGPQKVIDGVASISTDPLNWQVSPNGRYALIAYTPADQTPPEAWRRYANGREAHPDWLNRFMLVDLREGSSRPILDAPWGVAVRRGIFPTGSVAEDRVNLAPQVFWSHDSRSALVVNTALPLDGASDAERIDRGYIIAFDPRTGRWESLQQVLWPAASGQVERRVRQVGWIVPGRELLVVHETAAGAPLDGVIYAWREGRWQAQPAPATRRLPAPGELGDDISVRLRRGFDEPPVMVAARGDREIPLLEPDPALAGVAIRPRRPVQWTDPDGTTITGSIILPERAPGAPPPPLVIQPYYNAPDRFLPDGNFSTGQAAQAMAAQGIAVLYMDILRPGWENRDQAADMTEDRELRYFRDRVDAIVDTLSRQGMIDRERVGLIGFSRAGLYAYYTLTHPGRTRISSSIILDSGLNGWLEYTLSANVVEGGANPYERMYGNRGSFWENRDGYLSGMPIFNVDKIQGSIMFQYVGDYAAHGYQEHMGSLDRVGVPWEWLHFGPDGYHWLQLPRQRQASLQASVDWMSFWLLGRQRADADPQRQAQYRRWQAARDRRR